MDGVKVVDLSIALAGPWAVSMLADQGASVVKVEPPGLGDIGRWVGVAVGGMSAMAAMVNKEMVDAAFEGGLEQGLLHERRLFQILTATEDKAEGMKAFVEKREANWKGR